MTVTSTVLIKFWSDFIGKPCNICRLWGCHLHYLSNSVWCGSLKALKTKISFPISTWTPQKHQFLQLSLVSKSTVKFLFEYYRPLPPQFHESFYITAGLVYCVSSKIIYWKIVKDYQNAICVLCCTLWPKSTNAKFRLSPIYSCFLFKILLSCFSISIIY